MNTIRPIARAILPYQFRASVASVRKELDRLYRPVAFWQAFAEFQRLKNYDNVDRELLERLTYGWGNCYSAHTEYMVAYLRHADQNQGPILECGSGLSTLLLGVVAARNGTQVWSLEHDPMWGDRVQRQLDRWRITSVQLSTHNLQRYHGFDWYHITAVPLPEKFTLVICDGPPGETYGGRYGVLPTMANYLGPNSKILLDDYERAGEQTIVKQWQKERCCTVDAYGKGRKYAVITVL